MIINQSAAKLYSEIAPIIFPEIDMTTSTQDIASNFIENLSKEIFSNEITMDQIAIACALDYTSFRYTADWGVENPKDRIS